MKILIGADLVPTQSNTELFCQGDAANLVGEDLQALLQSADFRIFNLETPLTDEKSPIKKCGPNLIAPTKTVEGYKSLGVDLLTVANNHVMDQGAQGFLSTVKLLKEAKIDFVGGGFSAEDAAAPYLFEIDGKKIGIYACAEHEFSIVSDETPGANPFDALESFDHVASLKSECDFVIVLYHGGKEHYRYPSPLLQKICRKFTEKGADLVLCQHSHCVGCKEEYAGGTIVYGQGNFLFDHSNSEFWKTSLLVTVNEDFKIDFIPLKKSGNTVCLAKGEEGRKILDGFLKRSEEIKNEKTVEEKYSKFAEESIVNYLMNLSGIKRGFFFKVLNRLTKGRYLQWKLKTTYDKKIATVRNYIECEAHRELLLKGLERKGK